MYNSKHLRAFIDKVNEEAITAAQKVYNDYQDELVKRIGAQLHPKDKLYCGNGAFLIERDGAKIYLEDNSFGEILMELQYSPEFRGGFSVPDFENKRPKY